MQNSNVKLTWDEDDPDRLKVTKQKFTKDDLKSMDFKAYIASSGSEDEGEDPEEVRAKYRALLLGGNDDSDQSDAENNENDQEMEITFAPGLSDKANKLLEQKKEREERADETVFDAYLRKKAEKKKARRMEKKHQGTTEAAGEDAPFSDDDVNVDTLNDDFFKDAYGSDFDQASDASSTVGEAFAPKQKGAAHKKKSNSDDEVDPALQAIMADIAADETNKKHFDMDEIEKEAKKAKRKLKKKKNKNVAEVEASGNGDNDFALNVNDERFSALFTSDQYAIDPTCSKFKKTTAMETIVKERQKRQHHSTENLGRLSSSASTTASNLQSLVNKIKSKPADFSKKRKTTIL